MRGSCANAGSALVGERPKGIVLQQGIGRRKEELRRLREIHKSPRACIRQPPINTLKPSCPAPASGRHNEEWNATWGGAHHIPMISSAPETSQANLLQWHLIKGHIPNGCLLLIPSRYWHLPPSWSLLPPAAGFMAALPSSVFLCLCQLQTSSRCREPF